MARALPERARRLLPPLLGLFLALSYLRLRERPPSSPEAAQEGAALSRVVTLSGEVMGTTYSAKLVLPDHIAQARARQALDDALVSVDRAMSTYKADSELSRWNAAGAEAPVPISQELRDVLEVALEVGQASQGALDVTIGPLVDAWGFGALGPPGPSSGSGERTVPTQERLAELRAHSGLDKIALTQAGLSKRDPRVRIDLSAVAKGYAVDQAAAALRALGLTQFLVEVGGELTAAGHKPDGQRWRVAIERPGHAGRQAQRTLELEDLGLATSGDYRNYYERDGKRLSHLIDPRTARPVDHALASVSVFHEKVAFADAWATALSVLGPQEAVRVAEARGLMALLILRVEDGGAAQNATGAGHNVRETSAFRARFAQD